MIRIIILVFNLCQFSPAFAFVSASTLPEDLLAWRIGIASPSFYPAHLTKGYGVNESENWTSLLHNETPGATLSATSLKGVRSLDPDYDGFGLYIGTGVNYIRQVAETNHLPDTVYLYWVSLFNQRFFVTKFELTDDIKQRMMVLTTSPYNAKRTCYQSDLIFGLLPNGHAKVWIAGCNRFSYLTELEPAAENSKDTDGRNAESYRSSWTFERIQKRADEEKVSLTPIPWDKVNKTYTFKPR
ncbi:DUF2931 family protein [Vibrio proteolyticus]|uniref:DUF2931 family protein n=1 Tax=Vibrio proteolyticus NBRC 13287 TaxID=1219065 RepID=U3A2E1_VIBPR|nr:DUF2931 family protein [Vibrio proteolyticus]GAD67835.1 hypothetical protein VPR01S_10_00310 [Vibrio proteolyticus NBRC 13287]